MRRNPDYKRAAKLLGAMFFMGMGAFLMGSAYVTVVDHLSKEPFNQ
jgi:hypothetical protein